MGVELERIKVDGPGDLDVIRVLLADPTLSVEEAEEVVRKERELLAKVSPAGRTVRPRPRGVASGTYLQAA